jgi:arsenate reductase
MRYSFTMNAKIYHNPGCSKSRATLALLEERGIAVDIIEYLKDPPTAGTIRTLLAQLELTPADIVRTGETAFRESGLTAGSPPDQLVALITREPAVLQRPIVVFDGKARIGRPPEQVLELFA